MDFMDSIGNPDAPVPADPVLNTRLPEITKRTPLQYVFDAVVLAAESCWRQQLPITVDTVRMQNSRLLAPAVAQVIESSKFARAMEDRGIVLGTPGLSAEQAHFLRIFYDPTINANPAKRMRIAGVTATKLLGWRREETFARRERELAGELLADHMPVARLEVARGIGEGKLDYIKFGMELEREWDPRGGASADVMQFALRMLDVITEELKDVAGSGDVLRSIGDRMQRVLTGQPDTPKQVAATMVIQAPQQEE